MIEIIIIIFLIILILYNIGASIKEGLSNPSCSAMPAIKVDEACQGYKEDYDAVLLEKETKVNKINALINTITEKQTVLSTDMCPENSSQTADAAVSEVRSDMNTLEDDASNDRIEIPEDEKEQLDESENNAGEAETDLEVNQTTVGNQISETDNVMMDALKEAGQ